MYEFSFRYDRKSINSTWTAPSGQKCSQFGLKTQWGPLSRYRDRKPHCDRRSWLNLAKMTSIWHENAMRSAVTLPWQKTSLRSQIVAEPGQNDINLAWKRNEVRCHATAFVIVPLWFCGEAFALDGVTKDNLRLRVGLNDVTAREKVVTFFWPHP